MTDDLETAWRNCLRELNLADARFLSQPGAGPGRRNFRLGDRVYKIALRWVAAVGEHPHGDLASEFDLIRQCTGVNGIPAAIEYQRTQSVEVAVYRYVPAAPLEAQSLHLPRRLVVLAKLAVVLARLSWRGIAHKDITERNVLVSPGGVYLIDFDQARRVSRWSALYRNFLRRRTGVGFYGSWLLLLDQQLRRGLPEELRSIYLVFSDRAVLYYRWLEQGREALRRDDWISAISLGIRAVMIKPYKGGGWRLIADCVRQRPRPRRTDHLRQRAARVGRMTE